MSLSNIFKIFCSLFFIIISGHSTEVYREMSSNSLSPCLLKLVDSDDAILKKPAKCVTFPLSEENQNLTNDMMFSIQPEQLRHANAPWDQVAGMAANQWGNDQNIFVFRPDNSDNYEIVINPTYVVHENSSKEPGWEGCFSIPMTLGNAERFMHIVVTYQTLQGDEINKELKDWAARVFQHETDHLNSILCTDPQASGYPNIVKCSETKIFLFKEDMTNFLVENQKKLEIDFGF